MTEGGKPRGIGTGMERWGNFRQREHYAKICRLSGEKWCVVRDRQTDGINQHYWRNVCEDPGGQLWRGKPRMALSHHKETILEPNGAVRPRRSILSRSMT